ncbi:helix-turn-helix transcriptional regulator [Ferrimonas marina]|uniref:AraC-type DNA-binding protein n=1 Tax=Ferrimonas marina TaxID=299255 RepID=A0A1M5RE50_9GAMM|nr:helix-turn-helix transcriptional regulator [Ferrimonas marina]SHH24356.1 AraC-type DNA-binding protein [Ferrimonas marina]
MPNTPKTFYELELDRLNADSPFRPQQYVQIRQSKAFMEKYHADRVELNDLAAAAFMSRFHYVRTFQRMYGVTPRQYLRDLRIAKAKRLLSEGMAVTQVCLEVGYESLPTFSSVFKKCTGSTPKAYQLIHKGNRE